MHKRTAADRERVAEAKQRVTPRLSELALSLLNLSHSALSHLNLSHSAPAALGMSRGCERIAEAS